MTRVHVSLALYLAITGAMCLAAGWVGLALVHGAALAAVAALRKGPRSLLTALLPLLAIPLLYKETGWLNGVFWGRSFDGEILALENALFGRSPALWMSEALPSYGLSEALHLAYASFWVSTTALALWLYRRPRDFDAYMWTIMNTYLICYLSFILIPVDGPRGVFPPIAADLQGPCYRLVHAVLGPGAAQRAAFPSAHVAVTAVVAACAARWARPLFPLLALLAAGVFLGTMYGRFHYALDSLAGLVVAWRVYASIGPRLAETA